MNLNHQYDQQGYYAVSDQQYKQARQKEFDDLINQFKKNPEKGLQFLKDVGALNDDGSYSKNYYPHGV